MPCAPSGSPPAVSTGVRLPFFHTRKEATDWDPGEFPTGAAGNPTPQPPDPATDPLASQGALIISHGNRFLLAVNAGSNEISVLKIRKNELEIVDVVSSGGIRPISLTLHDDLLYVLNEGGTPNITGFDFDEDGTLTPLAGSTRPLIDGGAADPAQIGFSHDGDLLVVTDKSGNRLNTSNGMTPFGSRGSPGPNRNVPWRASANSRGRPRTRDQVRDDALSCGRKRQLPSASPRRCESRLSGAC
jgi:6-phosphogluconolactonase (cycloisomerase 2 family)